VLTNRNLSPKPVSKNAGETIIVLWIMAHEYIEYLENSNNPQSNQNSAALRRISPANRKKGFYTSRLLNNDEIGGIFSGSEL
jgi:hypothetical protein